MRKPTILVDEQRHGDIYYAVCCQQNAKPEFFIGERGVITDIGELIEMQKRLDARVEVDPMQGGNLYYNAMNYGWKIYLPKQSRQFPYIEFIVQTAISS